MSRSDDLQTEWLQRARHLDRNALAEIHDLYYAEIFRYVRFRLDDEEACQQMVTEVFRRFLGSVQRKRGSRQALHAWLLQIAKEMVDETWRMRQKQRAEQPGGSMLRHLPREETLEIGWEGRWPRERLVWAVQQLPVEQQHILALRFTGERTLEETAQLLGKRVRTVRGVQMRALRALWRLLGEGAG